MNNLVDDLSKGLFDDDCNIGPEDVDNLDVYNLELDEINNEALNIAGNKINNLLKLYNNKEFCENNPEFKRRVDNEIDSLRRLIKMANTNEVIHDNLAKAISQNPNNASLYMALARLQNNSMSLQSQISTTLNDFIKFCRSYQTEINFNQDTNSSETTSGTREAEDGSMTSRGMRAFVQEMNKDE